MVPSRWLLLLAASVAPPRLPCSRLNITVDHRSLLVSERLQHLLPYAPFRQTKYQRRYIDHDSSSLAIDRTSSSPSFDVGDPTALEFLQREGFVVFASVASAQELSTAERLMWQFLGHFGALQTNSSTWNSIRANQFGLISSYGAGQSQFSWYLRCLHKVRHAFAFIWGTEDLIADFGGFGVFLPWARTAEAWYHVDQNAGSRPGLQAFQAFISLYDQNESTGGLVVVPRSKTHHAAFCNRSMGYWGAPPTHHFLYAPPNDPSLALGQRVLVKCRAGDMVVWDSRTLHCNTNSRERGDMAYGHANGSEQSDQKQLARTQLQRAIALVALSPRRFATEEVLKQRRLAVRMYQTTSHWVSRAKLINLPVRHVTARRMFLVRFFYTPLLLVTFHFFPNLGLQIRS
jgi:hypothetical protein